MSGSRDYWIVAVAQSPMCLAPVFKKDSSVKSLCERFSAKDHCQRVPFKEYFPTNLCQRWWTQRRHHVGHGDQTAKILTHSIDFAVENSQRFPALVQIVCLQLERGSRDSPEVFFE